MDGLMVHDRLYSTGDAVMIYCGNTAASELELAIAEFNSSPDGPKLSGKKLEVLMHAVDLTGITPQGDSEGRNIYAYSVRLVDAPRGYKSPPPTTQENVELGGVLQSLGGFMAKKGVRVQNVPDSNALPSTLDDAKRLLATETANLYSLCHDSPLFESVEIEGRVAALIAYVNLGNLQLCLPGMIR